MSTSWLIAAGMALALVAVVAAPQGSGPARRHIKLGGPSSTLPFSDGVLAGDTLYLAGKLGIDPKTGQAPADLDAELRFLFDNVREVLTAAGMTMDDLVTVQVFCPDLSLYDKFNAAYRAQFKNELPARAFIGSGPLLRGSHFELQGIAVKR